VLVDSRHHPVSDEFVDLGEDLRFSSPRTGAPDQAVQRDYLQVLAPRAPTSLNPTNLSRGNLREGGTAGPGTRRVRKPALLSVLRAIYANGLVESTSHWLSRLEGRPLPSRVTVEAIAMTLLEVLDLCEYMAREHDPDRVDMSETELRRFVDTERHILETRSQMHQAMGGPVGAAAMGDTDGFLRYRSQAWGEATKGPGSKPLRGLRRAYRDAGIDEWGAAGWGERAVLLRRDLGERFLRASPDKGAEMVRGWVREFRQQGRLPPGPPPSPWSRVNHPSGHPRT
jgi:hypothetical protein